MSKHITALCFLIPGKTYKPKYFPQIGLKEIGIFKTSDLQNMQPVVVKQILQTFRYLLKINKRIQIPCAIPRFCTVVQNDGKNCV